MLGVSPQRTEVRGLPVYWGEAPQAFTAALLFRVGRVDETLPTSGITHLVEHLALFPIGKTSFFANGLVDDLFTAFYAAGTPDEVLGFLDAVARNLDHLPLERLETEKRILETEEASRSTGWRERLFDLRYGTRGFGLVAYHEFALRTASEDDIAAWARERFVRGSAAVWMTGPPPDDFDLPLPDGERNPPPAPVTRPRLALPSHVAHAMGGVALSVVGERSAALSTGVGIVINRAQEQLRRQAGMSYDVGGFYEPLDTTTAHVAIGADCLDQHSRVVQDGLLEALHAVASQGPSEDELTQEREERARSMNDPDTMPGWLDYSARDELLGSDPTTPQELLAEVEELTPGVVASALQSCLGGMLVMAPAGTRRPDGFVEWREFNKEPVRGRTYRETPRRVGKNTRVIAGAEGVTLYQPVEPDPLTIRFDECSAVLRWNELRITLLALDGSWIELSGRRLRRGEELIRFVLDRVPSSKVVPMDDVQTPETLWDLAIEKLGAARVQKEFEVLPDHLLPGERVMNLAQLDTFFGPRLLALTDRRLICTWRKRVTRRPTLEEVELSDVDRVEGPPRRAWLLRRVTLRRADGRQVRLKRFQRRQRAVEFHEALSGHVSGNGDAPSG